MGLLKKSNVAEFLQDLKIQVRTEYINKIEIKTDFSCKMQEVRVNNKLVMMGNYWDFHNGCYGWWNIREFRGARDLASVFIDHFDKLGLRHELIEREYSYKD